MTTVQATRYTKLLLSVFLWMALVACSVKVQEEEAKQLVEAIYKARKSGKADSEFQYYAKSDFTIVPFEEVKDSMKNVLDHAGTLKSVSFLTARVQKRNQLGQGLVQYLVLSYKVIYTKATLEEDYYFYGDSEKPKLVYVVLKY